MKIKEKWPLQLGLLVLLILSSFSLIVFRIYNKNRSETFYSYLEERAHLRFQIQNDKIVKKTPLSQSRSFNVDKYAIYSDTGELIDQSGHESTHLNKDLLQSVLLYKVKYLKNDDLQAVYALIETSTGQRFILFEAAIDDLGLTRTSYLKSLLIASTIISSLLCYLFIRIMVQKGINPVVSIMQKLDKTQSKNLNQKLKEAEQKDEIGLMAGAFNNLLDRLNLGLNEHKSFISYVSHELRTPLTIILGHTEVALLNERTSTEYQKTLTIIKEEVSDLILLANHLLALSKTNIEPENLELKAGRIDEVVWKAKDLLKKRSSDCQVEVNFDRRLDTPDYLLLPKINEELLKIAMFNLMENACKYSSNHRVEINILATRKKVEIHFKDAGKGIPDGELEDILAPFFRSRHTDSMEGHGLGLPLTKQIIDLHKGEMIIHSEINKGTTVILKFDR